MVETRWTYWYWHASNWWEGPPLPFLNYYFQVYRFRRSCLWIFFSLQAMHTHVSINVNRLNTFKHILKEGLIHELSVFHVRGSGDLLTLTAAEATGKPITCFFFVEMLDKTKTVVRFQKLQDSMQIDLIISLVFGSKNMFLASFCLGECRLIWSSIDWVNIQDQNIKANKQSSMIITYHIIYLTLNFLSLHVVVEIKSKHVGGAFSIKSKGGLTKHHHQLFLLSWSVI